MRGTTHDVRVARKAIAVLVVLNRSEICWLHLAVFDLPDHQPVLYSTRTHISFHPFLCHLGLVDRDSRVCYLLLCCQIRLFGEKLPRILLRRQDKLRQCTFDRRIQSLYWSPSALISPSSPSLPHQLSEPFYQHASIEPIRPICFLPRTLPLRDTQTSI